MLAQAKSAGLELKTVIDVGAATAAFTLACHQVFPDARYLLVEPLEENRAALEAAKNKIPGLEYVISAAGEAPGEVTIHVHEDLVGSSLYLEDEDSDVNGVPRKVAVVALEPLARERGLEGPFLIKVDVQGAELDVLRGAERVLAEAEYVLLEVSLFEFFRGGPQVCDVIAFMKERGFVPYDVAGVQYRPLDGAMSQLDVAFAKENGVLRRHHHYATAEQRARQNKRLRG